MDVTTSCWTYAYPVLMQRNFHWMMSPWQTNAGSTRPAERCRHDRRIVPCPAPRRGTDKNVIIFRSGAASFLPSELVGIESLRARSQSKALAFAVKERPLDRKASTICDCDSAYPYTQPLFIPFPSFPLIRSLLLAALSGALQVTAIELGVVDDWSFFFVRSWRVA